MPADNATDILLSSTLSWDASIATSYDVFFGQDPLALTLLGNVAATSIEPPA